MGILSGLIGIKNGDYQRIFKFRPYIFYYVMSIVMALPYRNLYNRIKTVTLFEVKIMRPLYTLLAVMIMLGPIGMGILSFADAPMATEFDTPDDDFAEISERGTRGTPPESLEIVNLYFYTTGGNDIMNTVEPTATGVAEQQTEVTFSLENALQSNLLIKDDVGAYGMEAVVFLSGSDTSVLIEVFDDTETNLIGSATSNSVTTGPTSPLPTQTRVIFESGNEYEFPFGNRILVKLTASGTFPQIHYEVTNADSHIRLNCKPVSDITIGTHNFRGTETDVFYPNDLTEPDDRQKVKIEGTVTDAFTSEDIRYVELHIFGPGADITRNATWNENTSSFNYTWEYPGGVDYGEYNITARVVTLQYHDYTYYELFEMSEFGVIITSPHQIDGEGAYNSPAKRNVIQNSTISYLINVKNIGGSEVNVDLTATGNENWVFRFESDNLTLTDQKNGRLEGLGVGATKGAKLTVDATGKALEDFVHVYVSAVCVEDADKNSDLKTTTTVKVKYEVEMEFDDGQKTKTENIEMGAVVLFNFTVTNTGGKDDDIWFEVYGVPSGWSPELIGVQISPTLGEYVSLGSGKHKDLTLKITTPSQGGDVTADIDITGKSHGSYEQQDPEVVSDTITGTIIMTSGVKLELMSEYQRSQEADPEEQVSYQFELTNTGQNYADFTVEYSSPIPMFQGWDPEDISFSSNSYDGEMEISLNDDASQVFTLFVEPTNEVIADNYTIKVKASRDDDPANRWAEQTVWVEVQQIFDIEVLDPIDLDLSGEAEPGEDVEYEIQIRNNGNTQERINVFVVEMPGGWEVDFGNANSSWSRDVDPTDTETIRVTLTVPDDAVGDETVDITVAVVPAESDRIDIQTHTKIKGVWYQPLMMLLVPILLFIVIIVMVIVIYRRR
jgi:uncharacterized membrane protein